MGKRGTQCTVCAHREASAIDLALARGVSVTALARRYDLGTDSIYRHRANHLPATVRAKLLAGPEIEIDLDQLRESESQSLLANLVALRHRLFAALDAAEEYNDAGMLTRVASQLHANLELTGKLLGDLGVGLTNVNVLVMPQYVELLVALVQALGAFPEARDNGLKPICVQIRGGYETKLARESTFNVSKHEMISQMDARLNHDRFPLTFSNHLAEAEAFKAEIADFRRNVSGAGRMQYEARQGKHDDMISAVALAVWWLSRPINPPAYQIKGYGYKQR